MEPTRKDNSINAFKETENLFNERKSNLSCDETNEIRKKLHKKEAIYNFLKEIERKSSLTDRKKNYLKNFKNNLKNYKNINTILHRI